MDMQLRRALQNQVVIDLTGDDEPDTVYEIIDDEDDHVNIKVEPVESPLQSSDVTPAHYETTQILAPADTRAGDANVLGTTPPNASEMTGPQRDLGIAPGQLPSITVSGLGNSILGTSRTRNSVGGMLSEEDKQRMLQEQQSIAAILMSRGILGPTKTQDPKSKISDWSGIGEIDQTGGAENDARIHDVEEDNLFVHATTGRAAKKRTRKLLSTIGIDTDDDSCVEVERPAKKRGKGKPRKTPNPAPRGRGRKKAAPTFDINRMMHTDVFADALRVENVPAQPTFDGDITRRQMAMQQLISSVPIESRDITSHDTKFLNKAMKVFRQGAVKPTDNSLWSVKGMKSALRPHQILGTAFMLQRERDDEAPHGGILADQMGLGKTIMMLACIVSGRHFVAAESGKTTLVVGTGALVLQWMQEISEHCKINVVDNDKFGVGTFKIFRSRDAQTNHPVRDLENCDIVLTTYEEVAKSYPLRDPPEEIVDPKEQREWWKEHYENNKGVLHQARFFRVCFDEAHLIRNPESKKSRACRALVAKHVWCLTGTPCVNGIPDLWTLFKVIKLPNLGTFEAFKEKYCGSKKSEGNVELSKILSQCMLRRTHTDRLFDARIVQLPKANANYLRLNFNKVEKKIYDIVEHRFRQRVNHISEEGNLRKRTHYVWTMILRLRQLTAHPLMIQGTMLDVLEREDLEQLNELTQNELAYGQEGAVLIEQLKNILARDRNLRTDAAHEKNEATRGNLEGPTEADLASQSLGPTGDVGRKHGLKYMFNKYIDKLIKKHDKAQLEETLQCVACLQVAKDPQVTSCLHVYCELCLQEALEESAYNGQEGTACNTCGQIFADTVPCGEIVDKASGDSGSSRLAKARKEKISGKVDDWLDMRGDLLPSAKTIAVKAQILQWLQEDQDAKIIVYTQWLPMINILSRMCTAEKWDHCKYTGEMNQIARSESLTQFGKMQSKKILLASLKCGGLGLNLTMASRVICIDPWWNNAIEQQAFCRVYRIGQDKETFMLHLGISNTIDERMEAIKKDKQLKIDAMVDENEVRKRLSVQDMLRLFGKVEQDEEGRIRVVEDGNEGDGEENGEA